MNKDNSSNAKNNESEANKAESHEREKSGNGATDDSGADVPSLKRRFTETEDGQTSKKICEEDAPSDVCTTCFSFTTPEKSLRVRSSAVPLSAKKYSSYRTSKELANRRAELASILDEAIRIVVPIHPFSRETSTEVETLYFRSQDMRYRRPACPVDRHMFRRVECLEQSPPSNEDSVTTKNRTPKLPF
jgi:hypothetical protein